MSYVCLHSHRSYIVMDPLTCGAGLGPFASLLSSCNHNKKEINENDHMLILW